ncbi:hypothetical protein SDC9_172481 [bioreactor metagenome]|uniref:Uncharacterized protein n=1 Tax=bioreactor metagenome TaxID=1076179 RepID=A0A645GMA7_9ZZZZ
MCAYIAAFVVGMQEKEQPALFLIFCVVAFTDHISKVGRPIQVGVEGNIFTVAVLEIVNKCRQAGQFGCEVQAVFQVSVPILGFLHPIDVTWGEHRFVVHGQDRQREHCHGMGGGRQILEQIKHIARDLGALFPLQLHFQSFFF